LYTAFQRLHMAYFVALCRVQEGTFKVAETTSELQTQRRRNALLEKQLGKTRVDQVSAGAWCHRQPFVIQERAIECCINIDVVLDTAATVSREVEANYAVLILVLTLSLLVVVSVLEDWPLIISTPTICLAV